LCSDGELRDKTMRVVRRKEESGVSMFLGATIKCGTRENYYRFDGVITGSL
jgi:hypothetical protein